MALRKKDDYFSNLVKKWLPKIRKAIQLEYEMGSELAIQNAKADGVETGRNALNLSKKDEEAFMSTMETLIKDVNAELSKKINLAINENINQKGDNKDLSRKIKNIFDEDSISHFNYKDRFQNIAITESTRIMNTSSDNTARRIGAKKKYLMGVNDSRQGGDSKVALEKYGSPEKAIPIDEPFKFTHNGNTYEYMLPPNRPRDREFVLYIYQ